MDGNGERVRAGRAFGLHACGLIGAVSILFFHPGAMDMDRLKSNLLLLLLVPAAAAAVGLKRLVESAAHPLPASLSLAALLTLVLTPCLLVLGDRLGDVLRPALAPFRQGSHRQSDIGQPNDHFFKINDINRL